jgi:hypothetical protein|nr:MAG TPA: hypothetical protein [Caudoviricetes sp.]
MKKTKNNIHHVTIELDQILEFTVRAKDSNDARRRVYNRLKRTSALRYVRRKETCVESDCWL